MNAVTVRSKAAVLSVARDYISLLKLRIVALLDATAIGVMIPAAHGHPRLETILAVLAGGTLAAGGAHAINCWFDRDIDAEMTRTRPADSWRKNPCLARAGNRRRAGRARLRRALGMGEPAGRRPRARRRPDLRLRLHDLVEAFDAAEHSHRRRGGRSAAAGGLGRRDGPPRPCCAGDVRRHLLLDPAALLGPRADDQRRLRAGEHPDAARGRG